MNKVLRGVMWQDPAERQAAAENLQVVQVDRLLSLSAAEREVMVFCTDFMVNNAEAPALRLVYDYFETANRPEAVSLLEQIITEPLYVGATFKSALTKSVGACSPCCFHSRSNGALSIPK